MYGYIYITTNLINGKRYIGKHKSHVFNENYKGSGKYLWNSIRKNGWDNFKVELIEECNSEEHLNEREKYWISYYNATSDRSKFYNVAPGGNGGNIIGNLDVDSYNSYVEKLSKSNSGDRHWVKTHNADLSGERNPVFGRICYNNGKHDKYITKDQIQEYESNGWVKGSHVSRKGNKLLSESTSNYRSGSRYMNNGEKTVVVKTSDDINRYLSLGYKFGCNIDRKGPKNSCYGKKRITNGIITKYVKPSELEKYFNNGFVLSKDINKIKEMRRNE